MLKVAKFGGSSVAGAEQFEKVKNIIESDESRRLVIVSAAGKRFSGDHKLTDLLYLCHAHLTYGVSCGEILATIRERFVEIQQKLGLSYDVGAEFDRYGAGLSKETSVDELVSRGEYFTAKLMAEYLGFEFVDAANCIFFGFDGQIDRVKTDAAIAEALGKYGKILIPGFYGRLPTGKIKVMTRGGSDITGALAAAATDANVYENWTDVSGILMADPKVVDDPKPIKYITYQELRELSFMGASVLHEESILPVKEKNIPLNIRNTNRPQDPGTMIMENIDEKLTQSKRLITGIAGRKSFTVLTIYKKHISTDTAIIRETLQMLENCKVDVEHITLGVDSFNVVMPTAQVSDRIYDIISDIKRKQKPDRIKMSDSIALIACVGRRMVSVPGSSAKLFGALGANNINIRMIAQGSEEISIIVGVDNKDFDRTIRTLYDGFMNENALNQGGKV